jgi:hypothetical protein
VHPALVVFNRGAYLKMGKRRVSIPPYFSAA